ncbi:ROK family protein [uncultured Streptococcus sp.]|uniref:ROK family protein n=1 Tax=uncultured Streptococcus sp. TaxID=83427 RepID=UPI00258A47C5|nr:ROK family protein [uncultured Streptococcus sp.]
MTILAIDFGGTQVKSALVSEQFAIEKSLPTQSSPQNLEQAIDVIDQIVNSVEVDLSGIAISVPGTVDTEEGVIYYGGLLRFLHGFRIKEVLEAKYQLPVMALNDGKAAALAELATGHLQGNGAALVLGSGLGGGFIINGKLFQGSHFQAGELTFLLPVQMEKVDPSLMRGMTLSAVGLITEVNEVLGNSDLKDGLAAFKAINAGDKTVYSLFESYCRNLAITILNLQTIFDMETFVIGGGISAQPILIEEVNRQFDKVHHEIDFIGKIIKRPKIVACHHHNGANLIGAAYFLKQK